MIVIHQSRLVEEHITIMYRTVRTEHFDILNNLHSNIGIPALIGDSFNTLSKTVVLSSLDGVPHDGASKVVATGRGGETWRKRERD